MRRLRRQNFAFLASRAGSARTRRPVAPRASAIHGRCQSCSAAVLGAANGRRTERAFDVRRLRAAEHRNESSVQPTGRRLRASGAWTPRWLVSLIREKRRNLPARWRPRPFRAFWGNAKRHPLVRAENLVSLRNDWIPACAGMILTPPVSPPASPSPATSARAACRRAAR